MISRRLFARLATAAASTALLACMSPGTAGAFGPCSSPTPWQNLETGYYVVVNSDGTLTADQSSVWTWQEYFQSCRTSGEQVALYSDYTGRWIGAYAWTGGYMYALDERIFPIDEYSIPWWASYELAFGYEYELWGYSLPWVAANYAPPYYVKIEPGQGYPTFGYGTLGSP